MNGLFRLAVSVFQIEGAETKDTLRIATVARYPTSRS